MGVRRLGGRNDRVADRADASGASVVGEPVLLRAAEQALQELRGEFGDIIEEHGEDRVVSQVGGEADAEVDQELAPRSGGPVVSPSCEDAGHELGQELDAVDELGDFARLEEQVCHAVVEHGEGVICERPETEIVTDTPEQDTNLHEILVGDGIHCDLDVDGCK